MVRDDAPGGYVRLLVPLELEVSGEGLATEWLWAEPLGAGRFRVESTPFFAYGLSQGDVVQASSEDGKMPRLADVERKSGHRTLRIAIDPAFDLDRPEVQRLLDGLLAMGCSYEAMPPQIAALDVPPEVDVGMVIEKLELQVGGGLLVWEWADPRPS